MPKTALASKLGADIAWLEDGGSIYAGSTSSYLGFGVSMSTPHYAHVVVGVLYRIGGAALPLACNDAGMVVTVHDAARRSGVLEGDSLLSIAGKPVAFGEKWIRSAHHEVLLHAKPGDEVELVWVRPGTGRMAGVVSLLANDRRRYLQLPEWDADQAPIESRPSTADY